MRKQSITKRQPTTLYDRNTAYNTTPETEICLNCDILKCNGECQRYKDEMKRLRYQKRRKING